MDDRRLYCPRGRSLGGSSSMNAMLYVRGRPLDYDLWEEQGADGWGWASIRPYFLKAENDERGASEHHGVGRPVNVQNQRSPRPHERRLHPRGRGVRHPPLRRLQQPGAGRRRDVPDVPEERPPLELRRRIPASGDEARQPGGRHARAGRAARARRHAGDRRRLHAQGQGARRPRGPRGDPLRGRVQLAADPDAVGHRPRRAPAGRRRADRPRPAGRRPEPPGPPVPHDDLGDVGHPLALPGRRTEEPRRVAAAAVGSAVVAPSPSRSASSAPGRACPRPTSSSTSAPPTSRSTARRSTTATAS